MLFRVLDLNQRSLGYEPNELTNFSNPRYKGKGIFITAKYFL